MLSSRRLAAFAALLVCLAGTTASAASAATRHPAPKASHAKAKAKKTKAKKKVAKKAESKAKKKTTKTKAKAKTPVAVKAPTSVATPPAAVSLPTVASTPAPPAAAPTTIAPAAAPASTDAATTAAPSGDALAGASASSNALFAASYSRDLSSWQSVQEPAGTDRITVAAAPGDTTDTGRPGGNVMRVELRPGDVTTTSGYTAPRAEVFGRAAAPMSQSADRWPDPPGSIRWYAFSLYVPSDFTFATDTKWLTLTQWKGLRGGSPPVAIEIKRGNLRLGGARTNAGLVPTSDLGPIVKGHWTRLVVGMKLSDDPAQGWVKVYRDGTVRVPQTPLATMDTINGTPDPVYLKQGIYRDDQWSVTHVLYFGPTKVGAALDTVA